MAKRKGYSAPKTRMINGERYRLEQSTKTKPNAEKIKERLQKKKFKVSVLDAPKSSKYKYEIYKRKK